MRAIQTRLAAGLSVSLIILLSLQWLVVSGSIRYLTEEYIASHLVQDSETILAALVFSDSNSIGLDKTKLGPAFFQPFSGQYFKLSMGQKEYRSRSLWDTDLFHSVDDQQRFTKTIVAGPQSQTLLQVTVRYSKESRSIVISVAEDLSPIYVDIQEFQVRYGLVSIAVAVILLGIQYFIVGVNLKPLEQIRRELKSLEKGVINKLQEDVPTEVLPLVKELNQQLKAFRKRLDRSRIATGNLAHALKTPLSILYQLAETDWLNQNQKLKESLMQSVDSIEKSISRELKRARIAGAHMGGRQTELEPEIRSLMATLGTIYREKQLNLHYKMTEDILTNMDHQDLMEMLGNVLDNACKWANNEVLLTVDHKHGLQFEIEDDGQACTVEEMERLTKRGARLDEQITGHGLGLSIVQGIVEDYFGQLSFCKSTKLGGLKVHISIPTHTSS